MLPPTELLEDCPVPEAVEVRTNGQLFSYNQGLKLSLRLCNADKAALRAWYHDIIEKQE